MPPGFELLRDDHVRGPDSAPVIVLVYGDFECPHTRALDLSIARVRRRDADALRYVFRHFPLREIHPHAQLAAEASEVVATLAGSEAYWMMHDSLFANQAHLDETSLQHRSDALAIDQTAFSTALRTHQCAGRVERDVTSGEAAGVQGTPAVFINGERYRGPRDVASLRTLISGAASRRAP